MPQADRWMPKFPMVNEFMASPLPALYTSAKKMSKATDVPEGGTLFAFSFPPARPRFMS